MNRSPRKRPRARTTRVTPRTSQSTAANAMVLLVEMHQEFLSFLERRVGTRELAEDFLQGTFVRATASSAASRRDESVVAWFDRVLRNALTDHDRRQGTTARALDTLAGSQTSSSGTDPEAHDFAWRCVTRLAVALEPEYAAVLQRVDIEGLSVNELAAEQGISAINAAERTHRARRALKQLVEDACHVCSEHGRVDCDCKEAS